MRQLKSRKASRDTIVSMNLRQQAAGLLAVITLNRDGVRRAHGFGLIRHAGQIFCLKLRYTYVAARERLTVPRMSGMAPLLLHGFYDKYGCCLEGTLRHEISAVIFNIGC